MNGYILVPEELLHKMYQYLVLYGLMHGIGETELYNTLLKEIESIIENEQK